MEVSQDLGFDLVGAILEKDAYNQKRQDHKIEARREGRGAAY
jgi:hypothetical protein